MNRVTPKDVENYWSTNPLCSAQIPFELGSREFFEQHNILRRKEESVEFQREVYEFDRWGGKRLLDIGCGTGYVVALYAANGVEVSGVDIAEKSIELSGKRLSYLGLSGDLRKANAESLPLYSDN